MAIDLRVIEANNHRLVLHSIPTAARSGGGFLLFFAILFGSGFLLTVVMGRFQIDQIGGMLILFVIIGFAGFYGVKNVMTPKRIFTFDRMSGQFSICYGEQTTVYPLASVERAEMTHSPAIGNTDESFGIDLHIVNATPETLERRDENSRKACREMTERINTWLSDGRAAP